MESKDRAVGRGGVSGWGYREKKWNDGMEKGVGVRGWGYREKKWNDGMEKGVGVSGWGYREEKWNDGMEKGVGVRGGATGRRSGMMVWRKGWESGGG